MTTKSQIKQIAQRHRWALVELTLDQKMQEANRMERLPIVNLYQYLKKRALGSLGVLERVRSVIPSRSKIPLPSGLSVIQQLQWYGKHCPWLYHAAVTEEKVLETIELSQKSSLMYRYLCMELKSTNLILELLRWLVLSQRYPRKSLSLNLGGTKKMIA